MGFFSLWQHVDLEGIMLREMSDMEKQISYDLSYVNSINKWIFKVIDTLVVVSRSQNRMGEIDEFYFLSLNN